MIKKCALFIFCILLFHSASATYQWTQKTNFGGSGRHRVTSVSVGSKGYLGLGHINAVVDVIYKDWWEYDPASDSWTQKANYPGGPRYNACAFSVGTKAYVGTGIDTTLQNVNDFYSYDPALNTWAPIANFAGGPRRGCVAFTIGNLGYVTTGSFTNDIWSYDPTSDTWTQLASFAGTPRVAAVGFAINGKGYVGTGNNSSYYPLYDFWEYDPSTNTWAQKASYPGGCRTQAGGFSLMGRGYLGCGEDSLAVDHADFYRYNPSGDIWYSIVDFGGVARRYLSCFTIGNKAYGGCGTNGVNMQDFWDYGSITGVPELEMENVSISIYPNPVINSSNISVNGNISENELELKLFDLHGKCVLIKKSSKDELKIDRSTFSSGVYFLQLSSENKIIATSKIVMQ